MNVIYICDHKACDKCSYPQCKHTQDVTHAVNFEKFAEDSYYEKEQVHCKECKYCTQFEVFKVKWYVCTKHENHIDVNADDFCSYAERGKDEAD